MSDFFASLEGRRIIALKAIVPNAGAWFADVDLDDVADLTGKVAIKLGTLTLRGTVVAGFTGTFGLATKLRIVGGAAGWAKSVGPKHYHNDAGVKASTVLGDAAREVGETLTTSTTDRLGVDFVRQGGPASRVMYQVLGTTPWWVSFEGTTMMGTRPHVEVTGAYELLSYDPRAKLATIALDDPAAIGLGSILRQRIEGGAVVREMELELTGTRFRLYAWTGGGDRTLGRIGDVLRSIAREALPRSDYHGIYRYRVVEMASDGRVKLQAVRKIPGLPDLIPLAMYPGSPGHFAELTPGANVLVAFIEGDPAQPIVTSFEPKGGPGFLPIKLTIDATGSIELGAATGTVIRDGDLVKIDPGGAAGPALGIISLQVPAGPPLPGDPIPLAPSKVKA